MKIQKNNKAPKPWLKPLLISLGIIFGVAAISILVILLAGGDDTPTLPNSGDGITTPDDIFDF